MTTTDPWTDAYLRERERERREGFPVGTRVDVLDADGQPTGRSGETIRKAKPPRSGVGGMIQRVRLDDGRSRYEFAVELRREWPHG